MCNCNPAMNAPLQIKIKYFSPDAPKIQRIEQGDWIDLYAASTIELKQFEFKLIPLGIAMKLPEGFEAHLAPRGSTFKNFGVIQTNSVGVIDETFCGDTDQWFFPALAMRDTIIQAGQRLCQFRIMRKMPREIEIIEVQEMTDPDRGSHGSTGIGSLKIA